MARIGASVLLLLTLAVPASGAPLAPIALQRTARPFRVAHVLVPLCDNEHQGIVPVSKTLGDGKDLEHNLYWGAGYGLRTFFRRSPEWRELDVATKPSSSAVLQRVAFVRKDVYVVADAYDGARMDLALEHFTRYAAGALAVDVDVTPKKDANQLRLEAGGRADLVAFVGHDGLMDLAAPAVPAAIGDRPSGAIVVACFSKSWFSPLLKKAKVPLWVGTTNLLSAEAYSVEAALRSWTDGGTPADMRAAAGKAYARYQKITEGSGLGLFSSGS